MCYRLIHEVHVEAWTVPHSSYHTLTSCVSVREKVLSHLALYSVQSVHHRLVEITPLYKCSSVLSWPFGCWNSSFICALLGFVLLFLSLVFHSSVLHFTQSFLSLEGILWKIFIFENMVISQDLNIKVTIVFLLWANVSRVIIWVLPSCNCKGVLIFKLRVQFWRW